MTPVLVAWRSDGGQRERLWQFLQTRYWAKMPDYKLMVGASPEGPFNRSAGINDASRLAGEWDVAVIADADTWVPAHRLDEAVVEARKTGKLVAAFNHVIELSQDCTEKVLSGRSFSALELDTDNARTTEYITQSSMLAVPRALWDRAGGMDEAFIGWGGEDQAFWYTCRALAGDPIRLTGPAWHLWHKPASDCRTRMADPQYRSNLRRWQLLARCRNERDLARARARLERI